VVEERGHLRDREDEDEVEEELEGGDALLGLALQLLLYLGRGQLLEHRASVSLAGFATPQPTLRSRPALPRRVSDLPHDGLDRAVAFYRDRFGFDEGYRFESRFAVVTLGPLALGLALVEELEPAGRVSLWLYCDDVDAEIETLHQAGVEISREPHDMEWGERMASVRDPDGNEIFPGQPS
jgi:lactoylglutathione lyase